MKKRCDSVALEIAGLLILPLLVGVSFAWFHFHLPTPQCFFREISGFPCPTCGITRGARSLFLGDIAGAWMYNPLNLFLPIFAFSFWLYCLGVVVRIFDPVRMSQLTISQERGLRYLIILGLLTNWMYVIFNAPAL